MRRSLFILIAILLLVTGGLVVHRPFSSTAGQVDGVGPGQVMGPGVRAQGPVVSPDGLKALAGVQEAMTGKGLDSKGLAGRELGEPKGGSRGEMKSGSAAVGKQFGQEEPANRCSDGRSGPVLVASEPVRYSLRSRPASYEAPPVRRGVEEVAGAGIRITAGMEVGFEFRPERHRSGAMLIANETGRALAVSFHGPGCSAALLNGQTVVEGRRYLVEADVEIASPVPVGVHVRGPEGSAREPVPGGVG